MKRKENQEKGLIVFIKKVSITTLNYVIVFIGGVPIKIGKEDNIDDSECLTLLNEYMCDVIKERKICQKLFIK